MEQGRVAAFNLIGKTLGKYQVLEEIGRGGMGAVYKGYDPHLGRPVAIKVLAPHLVWEQEFVSRFLREARAAARLQHPNIVTIFDVGEQDGVYYTVMEYVDGRPLNEIVEPGGTLPAERVATILGQVASALDSAHRQGLVHRDVKPGNILVKAGDQAVLTDFGIARALSETRMTRTGMMIGTPGYISPEQIRGDDVGPAADQYALGVVAYELLAGIPPFRGDTARLLYAHASEAPPPLCAANPRVSGAVQAVIMRALAKQPGERWPGVVTFATYLEAAVAGKKVAAARPGGQAATPRPRRVPAWRGRRVWLGAGFMAVVALFVFAAVLGALSGPEEPAPAAATATSGQPVATVTIRVTEAVGDAVVGGASAIPSATATATASTTPTATPSSTATATATATPTATASPTRTATPTYTATPRPTRTPTATPTKPPTRTPTSVPTDTPVPPPTEPPPTQPPPTQPPATQPPPTQPLPTQPLPTLPPPTRTPRPP